LLGRQFVEPRVDEVADACEVPVRAETFQEGEPVLARPAPGAVLAVTNAEQRHLSKLSAVGRV
jgi:hypothetical protein